MCRASALLTVLLLSRADAVLAQSLSGRFYPEKQEYIVGEPVFLIFDLVNPGSEPVRTTDGSCWMYLHFDAPTAPLLPGVSLFGCTGGGVAGDCMEGETVLKPKGHLKRRYLLRGVRLDSAGVYPVHAGTTITIYANDDSYGVLAQEKVASDFEVSVGPGSEDELAEAYEPILRDLNSNDFQQRSLALDAVVQNPPVFLEKVILRLADNPQTRVASITGLQRLGTTAAKDKLVELASPDQPQLVTQAAIEALGEMGDAAYCSPMLDLAQSSHNYSRMIALRAAGYLCGEKALPLLLKLLPSADRNLRFELAYALGNTQARGAVPALINLLPDSDANVRRAASEALTTLTHRHSHPGAAVEDAAKSRQDWIFWWLAHGETTPLFGLKNCGQLQ